MSTAFQSRPQPTLAPGETFFGFRFESSEPVVEIEGTAWVFTHQKTGARLLWLANADTERSFSITFKTPPADDTGVFHILEHSVLDGSTKYPVKEPFVELLKTSMATFINALTFPDKTMYPVASTNVDDLEHLMDVYLDAVFHPKLHERQDIFLQEGWHFELESPEAPLSLNGVVLNEMKGALADPDDMLYLMVKRALFPDTCYRWESGGDPKEIPTLTYDAYKQTHRRHYTPQNAHIVLYGDLDLARELAFLDERLCAAPTPPHNEKPNPLELQAPVGIVERRHEMPMAPEHAAVALGFVIGTSADRERVLATEILLDAIAGSNEAPLKRAILDSGLGDDLEAYVIDACAQPFVLFELKGARRYTTEAFRAAVHEVATKLSREGIGRERLEASLAQVEFALRERLSGYPDGIGLSMASLASWLYDEDDPLSYIRYETALAHLKDGLSQGLFEKLLGSIVNSNHSCLIQLSPATVSAGDEEAEGLARYKASLSPEKLEEIVTDTQRLHEEQGAPDDPFALATLPRLEVTEIGPMAPDPTWREIPYAVPLRAFELDTRGIDYVHYYFDLDGFDASELPYLSILASLLGKLPTRSHSAAELDTLIESKLGSFSCVPESLSRLDDPTRGTTKLLSAIAALSTNRSWLARIPREIWLETDFSDTERIRALLVQQRIALEQSFLSNGHTVALSRVEAQLRESAAIMQRLSGVDYYEFLVALLDSFDARANKLSQHLARLCKDVFVTGGLKVSFAGETPEKFFALDPLAGVPSTDPRPRKLSICPSGPTTEAFSIPASVDFVAEGASLEAAHETYDGRWIVLSRAMSYGYLWNEVRVLGGAYGAGLRVIENNTLGLYSFRDPAIDPTLERFAKAARWLKKAPLSQRDVDGYIVSCVGGLDRPQKARALLSREDQGWLRHRPAHWRENIRNEILHVTPRALQDLAEPLETLLAQTGICVLGQAELLEASSIDVPIRTLMADGAGDEIDGSPNQIR